MISGKVEASTGLPASKVRDRAGAARSRFLALPALSLAAAAFLLTGCGIEEENPVETAGKAAVIQEVEPVENQEAPQPLETQEATEPVETQEVTEPVETRETTEPLETREATEATGREETPVVPEPTAPVAQEAPRPAEIAATAPPPQPEPAVPGISTTQTAAPNPATVGQPLTFTVTVKNNSATQRAALKNFLSPGASLVSATPSQGSCGTGHHGGNTLECVLGVVPGGSSVTVSVVVTPTAPGTMTNTAVAVAEFAPATPANSASTTVTVNPGPGTNGVHKSH